MAIHSASLWQRDIGTSSCCDSPGARVDELWLYPGAVGVLCSACAPPTPPSAFFRFTWGYTRSKGGSRYRGQPVSLLVLGRA